MACPSCQKPKMSTPSTETGLPYAAKVGTILDRQNRPISIGKLLLDQASPPHGMWRASIPVKGHFENVNGGDPYATFRQAKELMALNGVDVSDLDLWLNLNIQWLERSKKPQRHAVTLEALLTAASGNPAPVVAHVSRQNIGPKNWGRKGWGMLQMYLAQDVYEWNSFYRLAVELSNWVNPNLNPSIGCSTCYQHYMVALTRLRAEPLHEQQKARKWLVDTMNAVNRENGKPVLSYEDAAKINFWT